MPMYMGTDERLSRSTLSSDVKVICNGEGTRLEAAVDDDDCEAVFPDVLKQAGTCTWKCNLLLAGSAERLVMAQTEG